MNTMATHIMIVISYIHSYCHAVSCIHSTGKEYIATTHYILCRLERQAGNNCVNKELDCISRNGNFKFVYITYQSPLIHCNENWSMDHPRIDWKKKIMYCIWFLHCQCHACSPLLKARVLKIFIIFDIVRMLKTE